MTQEKRSIIPTPRQIPPYCAPAPSRMCLRLCLRRYQKVPTDVSTVNVATEIQAHIHTVDASPGPPVPSFSPTLVDVTIAGVCLLAVHQPEGVGWSADDDEAMGAVPYWLSIAVGSLATARPWACGITPGST